MMNMNTEQIEQMRINSRRNGLNPKSWYHAGALDMQDAMVEKACNAFCQSQCGKVMYGYSVCGKYKVFKKAMED